MNLISNNTAAALPQSSEASTAPKSQLSEGLPANTLELSVCPEGVSASVRKLGGEIYLQERETRAALGEVGGLSRSDLQSYLLHFVFFASELKRQSSAIEFLASDQGIAVEKLASKMLERTSSWVSECEAAADSMALPNLTAQYFSNIHKIYGELNRLTVLRQVPAAGDLKLSLVEFDTEISGVPAGFSLPTLHCPQSNGTPAARIFSRPGSCTLCRGMRRRARGTPYR